MKVVLVKKDVVEVVEWDGKIKNMLKILDEKIYPDSVLRIDANYSYIESHETYEHALFTIDSDRMDQNVLVIGWANILDDEIVANLENVKKRVTFGTAQYDKWDSF